MLTFFCIFLLFKIQIEPSAWQKEGDWKARYSKLYSRRISLPKEEPSSRRITFLGNDNAPYTSLLQKVREKRNSLLSSDFAASSYRASLLTQQSDVRRRSRCTQQSDNLGGNETLLLEMVRARGHDAGTEIQNKPLQLHNDVTSDEDDTSEACVHGLSMRMTERSVSRSRMSRISTRRDMDIPSILAFTTTVAAPTHAEIPAFQKIKYVPDPEPIPRWSIRRSVCPVCSQKWKDRSSINNVKYSGLKRNSSLELPSVIVPARLRTPIAIGYVPQPTLAAVDEDVGIGHGGLRNTSATWQLTRARRFRAPKLQMPPPEATVPPSAPLAGKDLDLRVNRFLTDTEVKPTT